MTDVSAETLRRALLGLEHSGSDRTIYDASLAVSDDIFGKIREKNASGISFGVVWASNSLERFNSSGPLPIAFFQGSLPGFLPKR